MNSFSFQNLLAKKARFLNAEDVSPQKLSGFAAQIENGFKVIQNFLGNGTDYLRSSDADRKVLFNLSAAIGRGDKIYKPVNKFYSLEQLNKKYFGISNSTLANGELTIPASKTVTAAIDMPAGSYVAINYKTVGAGQITIDSANLPASTANFQWYFKTAAAASGLNITTPSGTTLIIKSLAVNNLPYFGADSDGEINVNGTSTVTNKGIFNVGYSIPLTNASYFKMATPCVHAGACPERTCGVCIGNTYDYDSLSPTYGYPICSGASFTYTADSVAKKTIQSPILTVDMPYSAKLMPYKIYDGVSENSVIDTNRLALYDKENNTNPIFFDVNFYSASSTRGDIVWIYDTAGISEANNNKKYLMLSSQYGLSDFMWDMSAFTRGF